NQITTQTPPGATGPTTYAYDPLRESVSATPPTGPATTDTYNQAGELASATVPIATPPSITTTVLPPAAVGAAVSDQLAATGGTGTLTLTATGLPANRLSLSPS